MNSLKWTSHLLPKDARDRLVAAAGATPRSSRIRAVNDAIASVKMQYPQFFKE